MCSYTLVKLACGCTARSQLTWCAWAEAKKCDCPEFQQNAVNEEKLNIKCTHCIRHNGRAPAPKTTNRCGLFTHIRR